MAIKGVFVATNCYVIILIMATFFLVVGVTLTVLSYRATNGEEEQKEMRSKKHVRS